jgi:hypothetical protein
LAELSSNRIAWTYVDDTGISYRVAALKALTDQALLGGAAAASTVPPKPPSIKMRRATVRSAGGVSRTVPLYSAAQTLIVGLVVTPINVNVAQVETAMTPVGSIIPERRPRVSVTSQST